MITPEYLEQIEAAAEAQAAKLNDELVARIAKRVADTYAVYGEGELIPASLHEVHQLMNNGMSLREIEDAIAKYKPEIEQATRQAFMEAAQEIASHNNLYAKQLTALIAKDGGPVINVPDLEKVGIPKNAEELGLTPAEARLLDAAYRRTNGTMQKLTGTTASAAQQAYIDACDEAFWQTKHGISVNQAVVNAIKKTAADGITAIYYPRTGHRNTVESAVARAVRTGVNQANADIILTRNAELGCNYVSVSAHYGARDTGTQDFMDHSWWQGQVYKADYNSGKLSSYGTEAANIGSEYAWMGEIRQALANRGEFDYPSFEETCGYGEILGICGINCRHTFSSFYPGINDEPNYGIDKAKNKEVYENSQKARAMERSIRADKRELNALKGINTDESKAAMKALKVRIAEKGDKYSKFCAKHNLSMHSTFAIANFKKEEKEGLYRKTSNIGAFGELKEHMSLKNVKETIKIMGIDMKGIVIHIDRNPELIGKMVYGHTNPSNMRITLYPDAFINKETLVKTIGHERIHVEQIRLFGVARNHHESVYYENGASFSEQYWWELYKKNASKRK